MEVGRAQALLVLAEEAVTALGGVELAAAAAEAQAKEGGLRAGSAEATGGVCRLVGLGSAVAGVAEEVVGADSVELWVEFSEEGVDWVELLVEVELEEVDLEVDAEEGSAAGSATSCAQVCGVGGERGVVEWAEEATALELVDLAAAVAAALEKAVVSREEEAETEVVEEGAAAFQEAAGSNIEVASRSGT